MIRQSALCLLTLLPFFLLSCTYGSATYGPTRLIRPDVNYGAYNYGYSEARLDSTSYQVTFVGDSRDADDRYALYRAAELTQQNGFDYFIVTDPNVPGMKTVRMYKGIVPIDNPNAYNANSMLATMGPKIQR